MLRGLHEILLRPMGGMFVTLGLTDINREQHNLCDYRHPLLLFK